MEQSTLEEYGVETEQLPQDVDDRFLEAEWFTLLEEHQRTQGQIVVAGSPILKASYNDQSLYFTEMATGGESSGFESLLRQHCEGPRHQYDPDDPQYAPSHDWDASIADVLGASLDAADADVEEVRVHYTGQQNGRAQSQAEVSLQDCSYSTTTWVGVLVGLLDDAPVKVSSALWQDRNDTVAGLSPVNDVQSYRFYSIADSTYEPEEADLDADTADWEYATYLRGDINPGSGGSIAVNGIPHSVSSKHPMPQLYITGGEEQRTLPVSPAIMTDHATAVYKAQTGQNKYALDLNTVNNPVEYDWTEFVPHILQDTDTEVNGIIELQNVGTTVPETVYDPDTEIDEAYINVTDPINHYMQIDDATYRVPTRDVQSLIPSKTVEFEVIDNYTGADTTGKTFY